MAGHSAGCCPLVELCGDDEKALQVGAVVMLACMHGHTLPRGMEPHWMVNNLGGLYYSGSVGKWCTKAMYKLMIKQAQQERGEQSDDEEVESVIQIGLNAGFGEYLTGYAQGIGNKGMPLLYVFANRDPLIMEQATKEFAGLLGVGENEFDEYSSQGELLHEREVKGTTRGMTFHGKSHAPHLEKYNHIILDAIDNLLKPS